MDMCRNNASAGSCATNPIIFEPMLISIVLFLQKRTNGLEKKLQAIYNNQASGLQPRAVDHG